MILSQQLLELSAKAYGLEQDNNNLRAELERLNRSLALLRDRCAQRALDHARYPYNAIAEKIAADVRTVPLEG